jgi:hypothetical protein
MQRLEVLQSVMAEYINRGGAEATGRMSGDVPQFDFMLSYDESHLA